MEFKEIKDIPGAGGGSKTFFKLEDGESITGIFRGTIHEFYSKGFGRNATHYPEPEPGASFRFRVNFIFKENGALVSKVWEQGVTVYKKLAEIHAEYKDEGGLPCVWVKIKRTGSTKDDTEYSILPIKQWQVQPEQEKLLKAVKLLPLENRPVVPAQSDESGDDSDEVPF